MGMIQLGLPFWALLAHHLLIDLVWGTFVLGSANYFNQSAAWDWVKCLTDVETHNEDTATFISSTCNFTKKPHWAHLTRLFHEAVLMTINYAAVFWAFSTLTHVSLSVWDEAAMQMSRGAEGTCWAMWYAGQELHRVVLVLESLLPC